MDKPKMISEGSNNSFIYRALKLRGRFTELSIGLSFIYISNTLFDYLLYPFVIYKFDIIKGGLIMTFLSFIACLLIMKFYDYSKRDWLGIEAIKSLKDYDGSKKIGKLTAWIMKKSNPLVFLFLSIKYDPFITTVYLRLGKFNGMTNRDWIIFMGSLLLANVYWTLACYMGITLFEWGWKAIAG